MYSSLSKLLLSEMVLWISLAVLQQIEIHADDPVALVAVLETRAEMCFHIAAQKATVWPG